MEGRKEGIANEPKNNQKPIRIYPKSPLAKGTGPFKSSACIDMTGKE